MKGNVLTQWKSDLRSGLFGDKTIYRHVWFDKGPVVMNMNVFVVKNASFFEKISQNKVENSSQYFSRAKPLHEILCVVIWKHVCLMIYNDTQSFIFPHFSVSK